MEVEREKKCRGTRRDNSPKEKEREWVGGWGKSTVIVWLHLVKG